MSTFYINSSFVPGTSCLAIPAPDIYYCCNAVTYRIPLLYSEKYPCISESATTPKAVVVIVAIVLILIVCTINLVLDLRNVITKPLLALQYATQCVFFALFISTEALVFSEVRNRATTATLLTFTYLFLSLVVWLKMHTLKPAEKAARNVYSPVNSSNTATFKEEFADFITFIKLVVLGLQLLIIGLAMHFGAPENGIYAVFLMVLLNEVCFLAAYGPEEKSKSLNLIYGFSALLLVLSIIGFVFVANSGQFNAEIVLSTTFLYISAICWFK